jgi:hypothetical protein
VAAFSGAGASTTDQGWGGRWILIDICSQRVGKSGAYAAAFGEIAPTGAGDVKMADGARLSLGLSAHLASLFGTAK